jgi:serine O-acetyltransferase
MISEQCLAALVVGQLNNFFPDGSLVSEEQVLSLLPKTLKRVECCFKFIQRKYYNEGGCAIFNHLHSDHYCSFLYILSNEAFKNGFGTLAEKLFLLNKTLNGIDAFYSIALPEVFLLIHPVGTVLGNARYGNYFTVYQNCGVGSLDESSQYPVFGDGVVMFARSCVLGGSVLGNNVVLGANSFLVSNEIPDDTVVVGQYPNHKLLKNKCSFRNRIFHF